MANDTETDGQEAPPPENKRGKLVKLAIGVAGGLLLGGAGGAFVAGPMLSKGAVAAEAEPGQGGEGEHEAAEGEHGAAAAAGAAMHVVDNLVLNPAGSEGTRFLMVTVAAEVGTEALAAEMKARDPQVRDAVLRVLERRTVEELSDVTQRDLLKQELQTALAALFPSGKLGRIYLPQFVIQ